jgi:hypothetical protein
MGREREPGRRRVAEQARAWAVAIAVAFICGACGSSSGERNPAGMLAERPALPHAWILTAFGRDNGRARPIAWRRVPAVAAMRSGGCVRVSREWTEAGKPFATPSVAETVCSYPTAAVARAAYRSQSLYVVGSEGWPNFEPGAKTRARVRDPSPRSLGADSWELGCGVGDPAGICAVWTFRARYGEVLVTLEFVASGGGIRLTAMRHLVRSVDRELVEKRARR